MHKQQSIAISDQKSAFRYLHQQATQLIDSANEALIDNEDVLSLLNNAADNVRNTPNLPDTMENALNQMLFCLHIQINNAEPYDINKKMALETISRVCKHHTGRKFSHA